jgi:uncharacterized integral membrane protein (TIGR00698 family)
MTPSVSPPSRAATVFRRLAGLVRSASLTLFKLLPGVVLSASLALLALLLRQISFLQGLSPLILALGLGMALRSIIGLPGICKTGVAFSLRRVLRFAVMLLGLKLSLHQVVALGGLGLLIVVLTLGASYLFTVGLGLWLRIDRKLCHLIAAGTSICGASAVLAANTVAEGSDEDAAYAVAVVTVFGTISMLAYPFLPELLNLTEQAYGLWAGASIHEVAQVLAATDQNGISLEFATISKLSRVLFLAPLVAVLGLLMIRTGRPAGAGKSRPWPVPGFVIGFVALCLVATWVPLSGEVKTWVSTANQFLLTMALAAMGLETDVRKLSGRGVRPLLLGSAAWLFIAGLSYALIRALSYCPLPTDQ